MEDEYKLMVFRNPHAGHLENAHTSSILVFVLPLFQVSLIELK